MYHCGRFFFTFSDHSLTGQKKKNFFVHIQFVTGPNFLFVSFIHFNIYEAMFLFIHLVRKKCVLYSSCDSAQVSIIPILGKSLFKIRNLMKQDNKISKHIKNTFTCLRTPCSESQKNNVTGLEFSLLKIVSVMQGNGSYENHRGMNDDFCDFVQNRYVYNALNFMETF